MASELKELVFKMNRLDCYKRYAMHKMLRDSGVYFGQPPVLDYLNEHGECSQKELSDGINGAMLRKRCDTFPICVY